MSLVSIYRVTVFVPSTELRAVIDGIKAVHALGDDYYDSVLWFLHDAREEFRARAGAQPTRGAIDELHTEQVSMLVFALPRERALLDKVLEEGVRAHHPWEKPGVFIEESWMLG